MTETPTGPRRVVLVRHGATDWSQSFRHTGWTDLALNGAGLAQARSLPAALAAYSFDAVFCSPLQRARMTALLAGHADGVVIDDDLREWHYGVYEGRTSAEIREHVPGWSLWTHGVVGGEQIADVAARADRFLARLRSQSGTVGVFAHGHLLRVLAARWIERGPELAQSLVLGTASISVVGREHGWPAITLWNDVAHLV